LNNNSLINLKATNLLAIIACILWATAFVGVKIGLKYSPPLQFAGIRFFISGLIILPFILKLIKKSKFSLRDIGFIAFVGIIQVSIQYSLFYSGMSLVPGALGAMIVGSGPLFVAIVAHMLMPNDRISLRKALSIGLGLAGIAIITLGRNSMGAVGAGATLGILLLFANNILSGFGNVLVAKDKRRVPPLILSSFSMVFGGLLLWIVGISVEGIETGPYPIDYYYALGWLSFLSAAAISIWYSLLSRPDVKVSTLNIWKFIIPVLGAALSWVMLPNEYPSIIAILGMVLVAIALLFLSKRTEAKNSFPSAKEA
jgi:drug/metabolite transporter (DMT)-like permease